MAQYSPKITYVPFTGEVEDNYDPLKIGRVRVRVHGYYSDDESEVPTEALPWAHVTYSTPRAIYPPEIGDWVTGYFIDGEEMQRPIVWGVLPGMSRPDDDELEDEPQTNRFARNEEVEETEQFEKREDITEGHEELEEPETDYDAKYPYNFSFVTRSGHVFEIDDTEGAERINIFHKTGSYREFQHEGHVNDKVVGNRYTITLKDDNVIIKQNRNIEIDEDDNLIIGGDRNEHIEGDDNKEIDGDVNIDVQGDRNVNVTGGYNLDATGEIVINSNGGVEISATPDFEISNAAGSVISSSGPLIHAAGAAGNSLGSILQDLLLQLTLMQTVGSPAQHVPDPASLQKFGELYGYALANFD